MAHFAAAAVIAITLGATGANLLCALGCDRDHPAAKTEHCHDDSIPSTQQIAAGDACVDHSAQAVISAARVEQIKFVFPHLSGVPGHAVTVATRLVSSPVERSASSPISPPDIPLRI